MSWVLGYGLGLGLAFLPNITDSEKKKISYKTVPNIRISTPTT